MSGAERVHVELATPVMAQPALFAEPVSADASISQAITQVLATPTTDPVTRRVVRQVEQEMQGGQFDFFFNDDQGQQRRVDSDTRLSLVAVQKEMRAASGIKQCLMASLLIQAYTPVGR